MLEHDLSNQRIEFRFVNGFDNNKINDRSKYAKHIYLRILVNNKRIQIQL